MIYQENDYKTLDDIEINYTEDELKIIEEGNVRIKFPDLNGI